MHISVMIFEDNPYICCYTLIVTLRTNDRLEVAYGQIGNHRKPGIG